MSDQTLQLKDLMAWHVEQAAECGQDEDAARDFHLWAATVLAIEEQTR